MPRLRISDAPLLNSLVGDEKIPTGKYGDYTLTPDMLMTFAQNKLPFATKSELAQVKATLESQINTVQTTLSLEISNLSTKVDGMASQVLGVSQDLSLHKADVSNPHKVTKAQVGLGNVDNTSDLNKPVSTATQAALDAIKTSTKKASEVVDDNGKTQQTINNINSDKIVSVLDFNTEIDDTNAFLKAKEKSNTVYFSAKEYNIPLFRTPTSSGIINGNGATINVDSNNGSSVVAVQLIGSPTINDVVFKNKGVSLNGSRTVVSDNTTLKNVGFYDFIHDTPQPNAWGLYLKNNKNISIENCHFGNNSQSDIAILEGTENVTIINARNTTNDGVYLNLEPNNHVQVKNVKVIGGKYRHISLLENSYLNYVIKGFNCIGATVKSVRYRGAEANFDNCEIGSIEGNWVAIDSTGAQVEYAGALRINNANLSVNYLTNPDLSDMTTSPLSYWNISSNSGSLSTNFVRYYDADGSYFRINNSKLNVVSIFTRNKQQISTISTMSVVVRYRCNNDPNALNYDIAQIHWFDTSGTLLSKTNIKGGRGESGSNNGWHTDVCVLKPPSDATQYQLFLTTKAGSSMDVSFVGVYNLTLNSGSNFNSIVNEISKPLKFINVTTPTNYTVAINSVINIDVSGVVGAKVGMSVKNIRSSLVLGNNSLFYGEVVSDGLVRIYHRNFSTTATITQNALLHFTVE